MDYTKNRSTRGLLGDSNENSGLECYLSGFWRESISVRALKIHIIANPTLKRAILLTQFKELDRIIRSFNMLAQVLQAQRVDLTIRACSTPLLFDTC